MSIVAGPDRPVVLIECADPAATASQAGALADAGFDVLACPGPGMLGMGRCELLSHGDCHLIDGADAIFHDLDLDDAEDRRILARIQARYPELPVIVEVPTSSIRRHADVLAGCTVVPPISPEHVAHATRAALELPG